MKLGLSAQRYRRAETNVSRAGACAATHIATGENAHGGTTLPSVPPWRCSALLRAASGCGDRRQHDR
jgi:hypothetical protein